MIGRVGRDDAIARDGVYLAYDGRGVRCKRREGDRQNGAGDRIIDVDDQVQPPERRSGRAHGRCPRHTRGYDRKNTLSPLAGTAPLGHLTAIGVRLTWLATTGAAA